jgi:hypothetical protein
MWYGDGPQGWTAGFRFPVGANSSLLHDAHTGSEDHPAFYSMVIGAVSPGVKRQA